MSKDIYLIVFAPIYGPSGYARLSRNFILGLDKLGVKIKLMPNRLWEAHKAILPPADEERLKQLEKTVIPDGCTPPKMSIGIAPWFDKDYRGYKIGYTMFEFQNVPEIGKYNWKSRCMAMDEVWVPSQYNYKTFTDNGINNVSVVEPGINIDDYGVDREPLIDRTDNKFRFIAISEYTSRKGWDLLIPAYLAEFNRDDNVTLIVKSYNGSKGVAKSKKIIK
jgi:glycosyltransferase involved in cell wall biosynthesis